MKELDKTKTIGPGGASGYILKECRQEMAELQKYTNTKIQKWN